MKKIKKQTLAPGFELTDTRGKTIRLEDFKGRVVVLVLTRGFV